MFNYSKTNWCNSIESRSQLTETIEVRCQHLLERTIPSYSLDFVAGFIFFLMMHCIEKKLGRRSRFLRACLFLQFLWSYVFEKLCPKYITLILSFLCITICKSVLSNSNLVARNRGKIAFGLLAFLLVTAFFLLEPTPVNYIYIFKHSLFCQVETPQEHSDLSRQPHDVVDIKEMKLTIDDQKLVLQILLPFEAGDEIDEGMLGVQDFSALFHESEPSFDEVCEAFSIFDKDRDGFFDAGDLRLILVNLGLERDIDLNACQFVIEQHDRSGVGKISTNDFCRVLETSLF